MIDFENLHMPSGGGSGSDGLFRTFEQKEGENLEVGDLVEFEEGKVIKTIVKPVPGEITNSTTGSEQVEANTVFISQTYNSSGNTDFSYKPFQLNDTLMFMQTSLTGGGSRYHILESIGTKFSVKHILNANVYGRVASIHLLLEHSDYYRLGLTYTDGAANFLNNTSQNPHLVIVDVNKTTFEISIVSVNMLYGRKDNFWSNGALKLHVLNDRKLLIIYKYYWYDDSDEPSSIMHTSLVICNISEDYLTLTFGTPLSMAGSTSIGNGIIPSIIHSSGRIFVYFGTQISTYAHKLGEIEVSEDDVITVKNLTEIMTNAATTSMYQGSVIELFEPREDRLLLIGSATSNNDGYAAFYDLSSGVPVLKPAIRINTDRVSFNKGYMGFLDEYDKTRLVHVFNPSVSFNCYLYKLDIDNMNITQTTKQLNISSVTNGRTSVSLFAYNDAFKVNRNTLVLFMPHNNTNMYRIPIALEGNTFVRSTNRDTNPEAIVQLVDGSQVKLGFNTNIINSLTLTPGKQYYVDPYGKLTLEPNNGTVTNTKIGISISDKELYVNNLGLLHDFKLGSSNIVKRLYTVSGDILSGQVVKINEDNTISTYDGNGYKLGIYISDGFVQLKGIYRGAGYTPGDAYYTNSDGSVSSYDGTRSNFIGYGLSSTEILIPNYIIGGN